MTEWYEWQTKRFPRKRDVDKETKMVTMTVKEKEKGASGNLVNDFQQEMDKCCKHLFNIQNQYESIRKLKEKLTKRDLICYIDFSENYSCKYNEEIQSIHFGASQRQVSLHTGVLYIENAIQSFCSLSDNL
ncbi:hypothetical protein DPMN_106987 [Dreissena polymorpha]|uniref:Uncharacterized protein n=1 Tax=Dreissena polymorpha TaxID=45954 RepID=A0A9D4K684_DREPO|nr:hypothetical protein DPMN_106987 [Dreissena polymorpha]